MRAFGWLGKDTYAARGVVQNPYPIALRAKFYPYRKKIHMWGVYYHPYGWVYERRRTWHGIINVAKRATIENVRYVASQLILREKFAQGVVVWHGMDQGVKDLYNKSKRARRKTGFNLFLGDFMKDPTIVVSKYILQENGDKILQENGDGIEQE